MLNDHLSTDTFNMSGKGWEIARELCRQLEASVKDTFGKIDAAGPRPTNSAPNESVAAVHTDTINVADCGNGWSPPEWYIRLMMHMHVNLGIPWFGVIILVTVSMKCLIFPLQIVAWRMPETSIIQAIRGRTDMMSRHRGMYKFIFLPLLKFIIFFSMWRALEIMAEVPVQGMKHGGIAFWEDLTVPDRYCIMAVCITVGGAIELEFRRRAITVDSTTITELERFAPYIILPITIHCSTAVQLFWTIWVFLNLLLYPVPKEQIEMFARYLRGRRPPVADPIGQCQCHTLLPPKPDSEKV